ncbi:hypothetical protein B484DRAFT_447691 [Ochromonadaceae sp. CCMP2298]|nr:hypothetical protein B484DRAFT_447691 [Ochromonadaceae sp. CCMP2298]|mmetsp:Transcript_10476/g.23250  ORF Transcript_10476/g.23250 Transcript_10476/m.23250 type:complete len:333 (-) Transcript_10476:114-1112(-)
MSTINVEYFDTEDFNLLDDDGAFEDFCLSMNFDPVELEASVIESTAADPSVDPGGALDQPSNIRKKRRLGSLKNDGDRPSMPTSLPPLTTRDTGETTQPGKKPKFISLSSDSQAEGGDGGGIEVTKDDVRAQCSRIFSTAFNNFDKIDFAKLLDHHCQKDCIIVYEYVGKVSPHGPKYIEIRGLDAILVFYDSMFSAIPDSLFTVHSTRLKVLQNGYSSIVSTFLFVGTKIYGLTQLNHDADKKIVIQTGVSLKAQGEQKDGPIPVDLSPLSFETENDIVVAVDEEGSKATSFHVEKTNRLSTQLTILGSLTYYINPSGYIYQMAFVYTIKD